MIGKVILIGLLCVSLTQVQGNELENAIKNGINRVTGMYEGGLKKINASIDAVGYKIKAVERKTMEFNIKATTVQQGMKQALREVAKAMEEKAKEQNKPESVFECIRKTERNADKQVQTLTENFKVNMTNLEKESLNQIKNASAPLFEMQSAIKEQYRNVVKKIQACKTVSCVDAAVKSCAEWLEGMQAAIGKIFDKVGQIVGSHGKEASIKFRTHLQKVNQIKTDGIRDMKKCVFG